MPRAPTSHPTPQQLTGYGLGTLPDEQRAFVADHLRACDECQRLVRDLAPDSVCQPASATAMAAARELALSQEVPPELALSQKYRILGKLGQVTAYYDANGHYARVLPAAANLFRNDSGSLVPIPTDQQFDQIAAQGIGPFTRCPGGSTQANPGWPSPTDHPFLGDGVLQGACNPGDVPPG